MPITHEINLDHVPFVPDSPEKCSSFQQQRCSHMLASERQTNFKEKCDLKNNNLQLLLCLNAKLQACSDKYNSLDEQIHYDLILIKLQQLIPQCENHHHEFSHGKEVGTYS